MDCCLYIVFAFILIYLEIFPLYSNSNLNSDMTPLLNMSIYYRTLLENNRLLHCLLPSDNGIEIPNKSSQYLLKDIDVDAESILDNIGRPYKWAQMLCGLDFFSGDGNTKMKVTILIY